MGIKIVTDSTSEISQKEAEKLNITVVPLTTIIDGVNYLDGIDLAPEEFYEKQAQSKRLPTTSQPSPVAFEKAFSTAQKNGDDIITICIASKMSGTCQSAHLAKDICGGNIWIIDSETVTLGLQILVRLAIRLRDENKPAAEIVELLEEKKKTIGLYAAVDTLEYLYKGGRLSGVSAVAGKLLNIKPLLSVQEGTITAIGKSRGLKQAYKDLFQLVESAGGIDYTLPFAIGYTGDRTRLTDFETESQTYLDGHEPITGSIGSVVGAHAGPGAVTIVFFKRG
jgi:DegV family protein with EDD domain